MRKIIQIGAVFLTLAKRKFIGPLKRLTIQTKTLLLNAHLDFLGL